MDFFWSLPKTSIAWLNDPLNELFSKVQPRSYEERTIISDPENAPERAFLCTSGTLKVTKLLSNGREILIRSSIRFDLERSFSAQGLLARSIHRNDVAR